MSQDAGLTSPEATPARPVDQSSMATNSFSRTARLVGAGAKVGLNYLKYYGKKSVLGVDAKEELAQSNAEDVYSAFSKLKGGPLKVAQMLSIDQGLLPAPYARTFAQAQYSAPPLSYPLVARTFRREFGREPSAMFDAFSRSAVHGASIGQVHRASKDGHDFAVKVQYPGVAQSLRSDLAVVKPIALQIMGLRESDVEPFFREVETRLLEETDYRLELERSEEISTLCSNLQAVRFPRYYKELSSGRVLTMDWVPGLALDQYIATQPPAAERNRIGQALWDFYHYQIHELRLFHADPHPGNFKVHEANLWILDFGCTKKIDDDFYRRNFCLLDPRFLTRPAALEQALLALNALLPSDPVSDRALLVEACQPSIELLGRPFRQELFDFGDPNFMRSIYDIGRSHSENDLFKNLRGTRGSPHSVYVNRAYFGLYSLLSQLGAQVRTTLPAWIPEQLLP